MKRIKLEPVAFWTSLTTAAEAVIGLLLVFSVINWTGEQTGAVMLAIAALGGVFTFVARGQVTPVATPSLGEPEEAPGYEQPED